MNNEKSTDIECVDKFMSCFFLKSEAQTYVDNNYKVLRLFAKPECDLQSSAAKT